MRLCALVLALVGAFCLPAGGAVLFGNATGEVRIQGQAGLPLQLPANDVAHFSNQIGRPPAGLFQQTLQNGVSSPQYGTVSAMASQVSSFSQSPQGQFTGASFAGTAAVTAATFAPYGSNTLARSDQMFTFLVADEIAHYSLTYNFFPIGPMSNSRLVLKNVSGPAHVIVLSANSQTASTPSATLTGTLAPGLYALQSNVQADAFAPLVPTVAFADSMTYTFTITPEPATLVLLMLGGLVTLKGRRA